MGRFKTKQRCASQNIHGEKNEQMHQLIDSKYIKASTRDRLCELAQIDFFSFRKRHKLKPLSFCKSCIKNVELENGGNGPARKQNLSHVNHDHSYNSEGKKDNDISIQTTNTILDLGDNHQDLSNQMETLPSSYLKNLIYALGKIIKQEIKTYSNNSNIDLDFEKLRLSNADYFTSCPKLLATLLLSISGVPMDYTFKSSNVPGQYPDALETLEYTF
ncbi:unnamed protein product [Owenia fusiformis]|uniref:Uncharacterized protein n=1 Tax=Owenia fusiformis TaxID=6347 RepID=A0A8J1Y9X1_OWEFU|nr:unnamed protein product [Owenia fusiformis]